MEPIYLLLQVVHGVTIRSLVVMDAGNLFFRQPLHGQRVNISVRERTRRRALEKPRGARRSAPRAAERVATYEPKICRASPRPSSASTYSRMGPKARDAEKAESARRHRRRRARAPDRGCHSKSGAALHKSLEPCGPSMSRNARSAQKAESSTASKPRRRQANARPVAGAAQIQA